MIGNAVFVGREAEMERLQAQLARTLEGQGQVCFVAGEAGAGKTTLVGEFTRRAQEANPELLVAFGDSNAQTGVAGEALVESGADLIGIFVPGGSLLTRMGARLARGSKLAARLEALVKQKSALPAGPDGRLDQTQIFEQYTSVI